jgi:hypothetical protein
MALLLATLLLGQDSDPVLDGLRWLARHQLEDGSWPRAVQGCDCPAEARTPEPKADPAAEAKARELVERFGDDDPEKRDRAFAALADLGAAALPVLRKAAESDDVETAGRAKELLKRIDAARRIPDAGATGLALLAFLGAGYTHLSKDVHDTLCFGTVVRRGLQWILKNQDPEGRIGGDLPDHLFAAFAVSEAYGLTGSNLFKDAAQKAIDATLAAQIPGKGWGRTKEDCDSVTTGWAVMVLKSAELSGLSFPRRGYEGARAWFDEVTDDSGRAGLRKKGDRDPKAASPDTATACALMARIFIDRKKSDPRLKQAAAALVKDAPSAGEGKADPDHWHFASVALFQFDGPSGEHWKAWSPGLKAAAVAPQDRAGCARGSWAPSAGGGRLAATARHLLALEVYYRYGPAFK